MDDLDSQYQAVAECAGVPATVVHRLKPDEMRVLAWVAENRNRIVSHPELAMHVFGRAGGVECNRVKDMLRSVRFAVCHYVTLALALTHYRGQAAYGVRWDPNTEDDCRRGGDEDRKRH